jgi:RNA polymerase sigma-70 factor (ECF subfamily)
MLTTSRTLLERLKDQRDAQAWQVWTSAYEPWLRGWLARHGLQSADVDDVLQDVLAAVWRGIPQFVHNGRRGSFRAWLRGVLANKVSDFFRQNRPREERSPEWLAQLADPASELSRQWDQEHNQQLIRRLLGVIQADFEPRTWEAFRLLILEDRPAAEVAQVCGMSLGAVYTVKSRVLARLREELGGLVEA